MNKKDESPSIRLLRLWLSLSPIAMFVLSIIFSVITIITERWVLLAITTPLAILGIILFYAQSKLQNNLKN